MAKKKGARQKIEESPTTKTKKEVKNVASTSRAIILDRAKKHLESNYDFRYNTFSNEIEYKLKKKKDFIEFDDWEFNSLMIQLDYKGIHLADYKLRQLIVSVYIGEKYDPAKEYIYSLPKWDGKTDYIKKFLDQLYLVKEKDREYVLKGFKKWFVAFIMSFIRDQPTPYNINQVAFILLSKKQGVYKSTWLGSIIPEHLRLQYYYPNSFSAHNKDHLKYLATRMLINLDEMESYNKTDIGEMKSIISIPQISLRLPYGRTDINRKRRASFCGSINERQFLRDETGSRRWFIVEIDGIDYKENYNVDGMYSQAKELLLQKYQYWFDGSDISEMDKRNVEYTDVSIEEELLLKYFEKPDIDDKDFQTLTASEVAFIIAKANERMNVNNSTKKNVGKALTKHGFERVSFKRENSKYSIYGYKVKLAPVGITGVELNSDNELF